MKRAAKMGTIQIPKGLTDFVVISTTHCRKNNSFKEDFLGVNAGIVQEPIQQLCGRKY